METKTKNLQNPEHTIPWLFNWVIYYTETCTTGYNIVNLYTGNTKINISFYL